MRSVGFEPTPARVKARDATVTPRPQSWSGVSVSNDARCPCQVSNDFQVSIPRRSRTFVSALSEQRPEPLNHRAASVGMAGLEPTIPCSQGTWGAAPLHPEIVCQSERSDLNRRSPGPRPGAITRLRYVLIVSSPCGSRTQPARLERPMTSPEVERAVLCAYAER